MMKRVLILLAAMLMLLIGAAAEEKALARDITEEFTISSYGRYTDGVHDKKYTSYWSSREMRYPTLEFTAPNGLEAEYLYICFGDMPSAWAIEEEIGGEWKTLIEGTNDYYHVFLELGGKTHFRLIDTSGKTTKFKINEVFVFSEGEIPDWVQRWEPPHEKADILILSAHPDDELLFFGGTIPTYAAERGLNVVVAYMTFSNTTRRSELLNGLWLLGVRNYPDIGPFYDGYSGSLEKAYSKWRRNDTRAHVMGLLRKYQPEVVITHDVDGEYGHGAHRLCADVAQYCVPLANDPAEDPASAEKYGTWQVKKLYLHLSKENPIVMDWRVPLTAFDGKTSLELAQEAYLLHVTQANTDFVVTDEGETACNEFGLVYTTVGPDVIGGDFLENIPQEALTSGGAAPAVPADSAQQPVQVVGDAEDALQDESTAGNEEPQAGQEVTPLPAGDTLPDAADAAMSGEQMQSPQGADAQVDGGSADAGDLPDAQIPPASEGKTGRVYADVVWPDESQLKDADGYLAAGEYVYENEEEGLWFYASPTLVVRVDRVFDPEAVSTWYEAQIFCDLEHERVKAVLHNPAKPQQKHVQAALIAKEKQVVFGMNTDYYTYRLGRKTITGMVIRDGKVFFERVPEANRGQFPNLDTLAMFDDGNWGVYHSDELKSQEYLDMGAVDVFSFGPYLVRDGEINQFVIDTKNGKTPQPRCAIGMVEPGHYYAVLAEGRIRNVATGVSLEWLMNHMLEKGCYQAFNLDGGQTAVFTFMGKQITRIGKYNGGRTSARTTTEIIGVGHSDLIDPEGK